MEVDVRRMISEEALASCLSCNFETVNLDFKRTSNLEQVRDVVELAKDVLAMANTKGGHLIVGVDDSFQVVGLAPEIAKNFKSGKLLNDKLRKFVRDEVTVHSALHVVPGQDGKDVQVAILFVPPSEHLVPAAEIGQYTVDHRGPQVVFRHGEVLVRHADESTRAVSAADYKRCAVSPADFLNFIPPHRPAEDLASFPNPYDFVRTAQSDMFKGRQTECSDLLDLVRDGNHVAVYGLQRIGKTSLVRQTFSERIAADALMKERVCFTSINLQDMGSDKVTYKLFFETILRTLADAVETSVTRAVMRRLADRIGFDRGRLQSDFHDETEMCRTYFRAFEALVSESPRQIVLFLDEFSELCRCIERNIQLSNRQRTQGKYVHPHAMLVDVPLMQSISSLMKNDALRKKLTFVFGVRPFVAEYDEKRSLQILKLTRPINLGYLEEQAAKALMTEPLFPVFAYEKDAADYLYRLTAGHPYLIQFILQDVVTRLKREGRATIYLNDIQRVEREMISDRASYDAQFNLLDSDFSIDEVVNPDRVRHGKGTLAIIAKLGNEQEQGWVSTEQVYKFLRNYGISYEDMDHTLSQLVKAGILQPDKSELHRYRVYVPLLRKRYVAQNMIGRFFR